MAHLTIEFLDDDDAEVAKRYLKSRATRSRSTVTVKLEGTEDEIKDQANWILDEMYILHLATTDDHLTLD